MICEQLITTSTKKKKAKMITIYILNITILNTIMHPGPIRTYVNTGRFWFNIIHNFILPLVFLN